jgi:Xaa-Pro aminopeptidase
MLSEAGCGDRRERLWAALPAGVWWIMVGDPRHVNWLSGFCVNPLSHSAGERGLLLLVRGGPAVLVADNFALSSAISRPFVDREITVPWYDQVRAAGNRAQRLVAALEDARGWLAPGHGLVEDEWVPAAAREALAAGGQAPGVSAFLLGSTLGRLRRAKHPDELAVLDRCLRAAEAGVARARGIVRPGIDEHEVFREVQAAALAQIRAQAVVYGDFRASSADSPGPTGPPGDHLLQEGETFILDLSVVVAGYRCDIAASIAVGRPTRGQEELLALCREAMAAGEAVLRPGVPAREVYAAVRGAFARAGKAALFPHHAGHGLGLAHPEAPAFVPESDETLEAGDVVTLEPGAYARGIGGVRIEHDYLVTDKGSRRLSMHGLEL